METWLTILVGMVALALLVQAALLAGMFMVLSRLSLRMDEIGREVREGVLPVLARTTALIEDVQPRVASILTDSAEISRLARSQVQRMDRVLAEGAERLRLQLVHADQILTGALDSVEEASVQIRRGVRSVSRPLQGIIALIRGVQTGVEFYRGVRRPPTDGATETQDESLFI